MSDGVYEDLKVLAAPGDQVVVQEGVDGDKATAAVELFVKQLTGTDGGSGGQLLPSEAKSRPGKNEVEEEAVVVEAVAGALLEAVLFTAQSRQERCEKVPLRIGKAK